METTSSPRRAAVELVALAVTSGCYVVFEHVLHRKFLFLVPVVTIWSVYLFYRVKRHPVLIRDWGFRTDNLTYACTVNLVVAAAGTFLLVLYRFHQGWHPLPPPFLLIVVIYPIWSLIQQHALECLVVLNLRKLNVPPMVTVLIGSIGFGAAHLPDWELAGLTLAAGMILIPVYLHTRNLYPLAFTHSWLGTISFYWVLERDPLRWLT